MYVIWLIELPLILSTIDCSLFLLKRISWYEMDWKSVANPTQDEQMHRSGNRGEQRRLPTTFGSGRPQLWCSYVLNTHVVSNFYRLYAWKLQLCQISIDYTLENYIPSICNETTEDSVDSHVHKRSILPSKYLLLRCIVLKVVSRSPHFKIAPVAMSTLKIHLYICGSRDDRWLCFLSGFLTLISEGDALWLCMVLAFCRFRTVTRIDLWQPSEMHRYYSSPHILPIFNIILSNSV